MCRSSRELNSSLKINKVRCQMQYWNGMISPPFLSLALDPPSIPPSLPDFAAVRIVGKPPLCHSCSVGNVCKQAAHPAVLAFVEVPTHSAWAGTYFTDIRMRGACAVRSEQIYLDLLMKSKKGQKNTRVEKLQCSKPKVQKLHGGFSGVKFLFLLFYLIWLPGWTYKDHSV